MYLLQTCVSRYSEMLWEQRQTMFLTWLDLDCQSHWWKHLPIRKSYPKLDVNVIKFIFMNSYWISYYCFSYYDFMSFIRLLGCTQRSHVCDPCFHSNTLHHNRSKVNVRTYRMKDQQQIANQPKNNCLMSNSLEAKSTIKEKEQHGSRRGLAERPAERGEERQLGMEYKLHKEWRIDKCRDGGGSDWQRTKLDTIQICWRLQRSKRWEKRLKDDGRREGRQRQSVGGIKIIWLEWPLSDWDSYLCL